MLEYQAFESTYRRPWRDRAGASAANPRTGEVLTEEFSTITIVGMPEAELTWHSMTIGVVDTPEGPHIHVLEGSPTLAYAFTGKHPPICDPQINKSEITIVGRLDAEGQLAQVDSRRVEDDYVAHTNGGISLWQYLTATYHLGDNMVKESATGSIAWAAPRAQRDYAGIWGNPAFSPEELRAMKPKISPELARAAQGRIPYGEIRKLATTRYSRKDYTFVGLHGEPSGGKTTLAMALAEELGAAYIYLQGVPSLTLDQLLARMITVTRAPLLTEAQARPLIAEATADLANASASGDPARINEVLARLERLQNLTSSRTDLVRQEGTLLKVLRALEPGQSVVVCLDEADQLDPETAVSFATLISEKRFRDGAELREIKGDPIWIWAWNDSSPKGHAFDPKLIARMDQIQVPPVPERLRTAYDKATTMGTPFTAPRVGNITVRSVYKDNALMASAKDQENFLTESDTLWQQVNQALWPLTIGKDIKAGRKSACQIDPRGLEAFRDYLLNYDTPEHGVQAYVYNLIPGGGRLQAGTHDQSYHEEDPVPHDIAVSVLGKVSNQLAKVKQMLLPTTATTSVKRYVDVASEILQHPIPAQVATQVASPAAPEPAAPVDIPTTSSSDSSSNPFEGWNN